MKVYSLHPLRFICWLLKSVAYHKTQAIIYFISPYKMYCYQKHNEYLIKHTPDTARTFTRFLCLHHAPQPQLYTFLLSKLLLPGFSSEEPTQMELMAFFFWVFTELVNAPYWIIVELRLTYISFLLRQRNCLTQTLSDCVRKHLSFLFCFCFLLSTSCGIGVPGAISSA